MTAHDTDLALRASFDREGRATHLGRVRCSERRVLRRSSARGGCAESKTRCGMTRHGADGPARRSSSVRRAWWTGPPPIRSPRAAAGRDRMARSPRRIPGTRDACGYWTRAWGQCEPTHERTGRLKKPGTMDRLLKGGLDIPSTHARCSSLRGNTRSGRLCAAFGHALGGSGSVNLCLSSDSCLL